jgi:amino acid transporter
LSSPDEASVAEDAPHLAREVGPFGLTAIAINGIIGAGIFVLPATAARLLGPASPVAYLLAAVAAGLIALCFAEAGSRCDDTGGPYVYARAAFGRFVGFEAGWMFLVSRVTAVAAIANGFCAYLGFFWPALGTGAPRALAMTAALGGLCWVNVLGVRRGSLAVDVFTVGKLLPLLLFASVGLAHAAPGSWTLRPPAWGPLREASLVLVFAFGGFESASVPSEEMVRSRRNLPMALLVAVGATALLYVAIQIAVLGALGEVGRVEAEAPLASAATVLLGPAGAAVMAIGAVLSTLGATSSNVLAAPRMIYALARAGLMPEALGRIHPRHRTPHVAILVFAAAALALGVSGSFAHLAALSAIARLFFNATTCLAVPVLRRKQTLPGPVFLLPAGPLVPILATAVALWLLSGSSPREAVSGAAALVVGLVLFWLGRRHA